MIEISVPSRSTLPLKFLKHLISHVYEVGSTSHKLIPLFNATTQLLISWHPIIEITCHPDTDYILIISFYEAALPWTLSPPFSRSGQ
jgi:hypothetical protein